MEDNRYLLFPNSRPVVATEPEEGIEQQQPRRWLSPSVQAAVGVYVPYLPEPRSTDSGRGSRSEVFGRHVAGFSRAFQRVFQMLSEPHVRRVSFAIERDRPFWTFDLRICGGGTPGSTGSSIDSNLVEIGAPPRIILLIKGVVETSPGKENASLELLKSKLDELATRFRTLAPNDLTTIPIFWVTEGPLAIVKGRKAYVRADGVGIGAGYNHSVEIRRALAGSLGRRYSKIEDYKQEAKKGLSATVPLLWPASSSDGLTTCTAILAQRCATVLSIRVHPSRLTQVEASAMAQRLNAITATTSPDDVAARATLQTLLKQRDLFQCAVQISSESHNVAVMVGQALIAEHLLSGTRRNVSSDSRHLSAVPAVIPAEQVVAEYNLRNVEMLSWGCAWPEVLQSSQPAGAEKTNLQQSYLNTSNGLVTNVDVKTKLHTPLSQLVNLLALPDFFLERDAEEVLALARMRSLFTVGELLSVWRLPVVPPGGYPGLQSRYPNPFEQLPEPTPSNGDAVSLGFVQLRGLDTSTEFRVPFLPQRDDQKVPGVAGVGDRSIVVAGSPGSGKTNFCLWFLRQLWSANNPKDEGHVPRDRRTPFLVIDPTRGNEFRALLDRKSVEGTDDVLLFTVGDPRCSPFCFNPFQVPQRVSVQSHISRLMSCFRAAYEMWDPLPAIFEMALRRAYEGTRKQWWEKRERESKSSDKSARSWTASIDFAQDDDEPFPILADVVAAMGKGEPGEKFNELPTVMSEQKEMWGGTTDNAHTIVASTYLRLRNLSDNYDTIIGGPSPDRQCVDLRKLMDKPAVLEFGMIGDSQALALIMSFFVCSLAGTIEGRVIPESGEREIHMLVLEEAHRLLAGDHGGGKQGSNSKAQAAEDINTMLAEVRKYGQGVMIIDQRPGSLVGGVIDNAYLVAMHRLNEEKGFRQFVQQLNLNADQQRYVRSELRPGQMVVLDRRSGAPVLLRPGNQNTDAAKMSDAALRDLMHDRVKRVFGDYKKVEQCTPENGALQVQLDGVPASLPAAQPSASVSLVKKANPVAMRSLVKKANPVAMRPYEDILFNTLDAYGKAEEGNRKVLAKNYFKDVKEFGRIFDKELKNEPDDTLLLKVTQWFINNRGASADIIESIKGHLE